MKRINLISRLLILILLVGFLIFMVKYAKEFRGLFAAYSGKGVAGASTKFEENVQKDIGEYAGSIKKQILDLRVSDFINSFIRIQKIGKDAENAIQIIEMQIRKIGK